VKNPSDTKKERKKKSAVTSLSKEAQSKWDELDLDESGYLEGPEIMEMAEWVWCSFRPGQSITPEASSQKEALKDI